jgi:twinkle protein
MESKPIPDKTHIACPCGKSSDAYTLYDDGHGHCFSCNVGFQPDAKITPEKDASSLQYVDYRGINSKTSERYGVKSEVLETGEVRKRLYKYPWEGTKVRLIKKFTKAQDTDAFYTEGNMKRSGLFGKDKFDAGSTRSVTITEGEEDTLSVYQMLNGVSAVVSIQSAGAGKSDCIADRDWLNSFDRIYLCLDNDDPGRKAADAIAPLFDFNKVYHVKLNKHKDGNDYLTKGDGEVFRNTWYAAKRFIPEGIISTYSEFRDILKGDEGKVLGTYPFPSLEKSLRSIREGEIILFDAMEGIGKTEILRAIEYHLLTTTDHNLGVIHLEESKKRQLQGYAGLFEKKPMHYEENDDPRKVMEILEKLTGRDNRLHLYSHFGSDDPNIIIDRIRFLVAVLDCKIVTLDHITMVVTGLNVEDERRALDQLSTRLAMLVQELNFALILISHVNDHDQTRGSRNISKVANTRISLRRDIEDPDEIKRNTTSFIIKKNRFGSKTGPGGQVFFNEDTFTIENVGEKPPTEFRK